MKTSLKTILVTLALASGLTLAACGEDKVATQQPAAPAANAQTATNAQDTKQQDKPAMQEAAAGDKAANAEQAMPSSNDASAFLGKAPSDFVSQLDNLKGAEQAKYFFTHYPDYLTKVAQLDEAQAMKVKDLVKMISNGLNDEYLVYTTLEQQHQDTTFFLVKDQPSGEGNYPSLPKDDADEAAFAKWNSEFHSWLKQVYTDIESRFTNKDFLESYILTKNPIGEEVKGNAALQAEIDKFMPKYKEVYDLLMSADPIAKAPTGTAAAKALAEVQYAALVNNLVRVSLKADEFNSALISGQDEIIDFLADSSYQALVNAVKDFSQYYTK